MSTGVSIPRQASDGTFLPSARDISLAVHKDVDNPHLHLTAMAAIWGQLVHNDISHTPQMAGELIVFSSLVGEPPCVVFIIPIYPQPLSPPSSPLLPIFLLFPPRHDERCCWCWATFSSYLGGLASIDLRPSLLQCFLNVAGNSLGLFISRFSGSAPQVLRREFARISSRMLPNPAARHGSCQRSNQHQMPRVRQIGNGPQSRLHARPS